MDADVIVTDGRVLTMDPARPQCEALAIKSGRIAALGSKQDIAALKGPSTRVISAQGNSVLPGFIEAHMHLFGGAAELHHLPLGGLRGFDAVAKAVRAYVPTQPDAKVIFGKGADYSMMGAEGSINRHHMDRMCPDRPFAISSADHHTMWANTKALEATGLLHGKNLGPGNEIVMGEDGLASGELREVEAFGPVIEYSGEDRATLGLSTGGEPQPAPSKEGRASDIETIKRGLEWCAKHGITSIHNMDGNLYTLELLSEIEAQGSLLCRNKVPFHFKNFMKVDMLEKASLMAERYNSDFLSSGLVKFFYDGVLDSYTACMVDDYADRPGYKGEPLFTQEQFNEAAIEADRRKLQIAVHCIGDAAVRRVLNGYEAARKANGNRDSRHRIEHVEVIAEADVPRFQELGVIASMQPPHPPGCMDFPLEPTISRIGRKRWPLSYPWRTMKNSGAHVVFASDWPVARIDVLAGIQAAVTRKPWGSGLPDQRFTLTEAIAGYTVEGAYAEYAENKKGVLKEGFLGDVVVLSGDIESTPASEISKLHPVMTICGGRVTYEA
jgi:predicted amidohydrolase YtcJ